MPKLIRDDYCCAAEAVTLEAATLAIDPPTGHTSLAYIMVYLMYDTCGLYHSNYVYRARTHYYVGCHSRFIPTSSCARVAVLFNKLPMV